MDSKKVPRIDVQLGNYLRVWKRFINSNSHMQEEIMKLLSVSLGSPVMDDDDTTNIFFQFLSQAKPAIQWRIAQLLGFFVANEITQDDFCLDSPNFTQPRSKHVSEGSNDGSERQNDSPQNSDDQKNQAKALFKEKKDDSSSSDSKS